MNQLVVLKFGGTSVGESDARSRVRAIVQAERRPSVIVVSALAGVTEELLRVAGAGGSPGGTRRLQALLDRHLDAASAVRDQQARMALERELRRDAANVAEALAVSSRSAAALRDTVVAVGELWSSRWLAAHPVTISPAVEQQIPVLVRNSHPPSAPGTRVSGDRGAPGRAVAGLAFRSGVSLVQVISRPGHGLAIRGQLRETLREFRLEPVLAEDRGDRLILSFHENAPSSAGRDGGAASLPGDVLRNRLSEVAEVVVQHPLAMIVIVSEDPAAHGTVAGEAASALREVPVRLTGRPAGGRTLAFVLDEACVPAAMHRLHERFFGADAHTPSMSCHAVQA